MIVCKFGGTSVGSGERFAATAERVLERRDGGCLAVVSAMARVTRELLRLGELAVAGEEAAARELLDAIVARHRAALAEAGVAPAEAAWVVAALEAERARVEGLLAAAAAGRHLPAAASDALLATGELLSSRLLVAVLRSRGADALWIDPRDLVATDARFGRARPDEAAIGERVARLVRPALARGQVAVTGGFVGREPGGATTILGWEASDYSATLLGAALPATLVEIFSDVDGVFTADPRVVPTARLIPAMSYREAADLAFFGAKVLHPATMGPVARRSVPVRIRNSFRPEHEGTLVTAAGAGPGPRGVAATAGLAAAALRELAAEACGALLLEAQSGGAAAGGGRPHAAGATAPEVAELERLAQPAGDVAELALVSVVGAGWAPALAARAAGALDGLPFVAIPPDGCETHRSFALPAAARVEALCRLERSLFEGAAP